MPSRVARVVTTAALFGALAWSPSMGWTQNTVPAPLQPMFPEAKPPLETMLLVYDPQALEELVEIRALLAQLVGALQKPAPPSSLPTPLPIPPKQ